MRLKPRTACRLHSLILPALLVALTSTSTFSQQQRGRAKPASTTQNKAAERTRRAQAITLLIETADKARLFDGLYSRAKIQMLVADALWPHDERQARAIFRRAWEAAAASDKAETEEAARGTGLLPPTSENVTDARDEVLGRAALRDSRLAEIFLHDLLGEKDSASVEGNEPTNRAALRGLSAMGERRLSLASDVLEAGETRRAVEIVAPIINEGVRPELIAFIMRLRERSIPEADAFYLRLLERAAADPQTNANEVLLLSTPIISPRLLVVVDESGALQFNVLTLSSANAATQQQPISDRAQIAFYNLAASVLSRPLTQRDGAQTMQDLMSRFYATGRLLPFFENSSAPYAAYAPALRARQSELFNEIEASRREQFSSQFGVSSLTPAGFVDPLRSGAEQLTQITDSQERERLALNMVKTAVNNKYWDRARRIAAEIEDLEKRRAALSFIQVYQIKDISDAYRDKKEDDFASVAKFVREADVPPFAKAWGLAQVAIIAARKRNAQTSQTVAQLINEAESYASRIAQGKFERVAAYAAVTATAARLDPPRAWGLLGELVKAANAVEDFTGEEVSIDLDDDENFPVERSPRFIVGAEVFRLNGIFATMAHLDFDKTLAEARALDDELPQAFATIAIARAALEKQNSGVSQKL